VREQSNRVPFAFSFRIWNCARSVHDLRANMNVPSSEMRDTRYLNSRWAFNGDLSNSVAGRSRARPFGKPFFWTTPRDVSDPIFKPGFKPDLHVSSEDKIVDNIALEVGDSATSSSLDPYASPVLSSIE
jgi:hypothetical protein